MSTNNICFSAEIRKITFFFFFFFFFENSILSGAMYSYRHCVRKSCLCDMQMEKVQIR